MDIQDSTVLKHAPHCWKVKGLSQATTAATESER